MVTKVCHWFERRVLLYSTVNVWPAPEVTSKAKMPPLQRAFVSASWLPDTEVKVPPVYPPSGGRRGRHLRRGGIGAGVPDRKRRRRDPCGPQQAAPGE